jgi:ribonucleoside-diphosphate reductase alpha chain
MEFIPGYREANAPKRPGGEELVAAPAAAPVLKVNGHRSATIADLEHAEAVMGASAQTRIIPEPQNPETQLQDGLSEQDRQFAHFQSDAPACDNCGALTVRCGTCYRCFNCGNSMGCS